MTGASTPRVPYAVLVVRHPYDIYGRNYVEQLGLEDGELDRCVSVYQYDNYTAALEKYAETPCLASVIVEDIDPADLYDIREEGFDWLSAFMRGEKVEPLWGCE